MSLHYYGCSWLRDNMEPCDLDGDRSYMCEECLSHLLKCERPPGWSPRVKRVDLASDRCNCSVPVKIPTSVLCQRCLGNLP
jgi:hypothetical protein